MRDSATGASRHGARRAPWSMPPARGSTTCSRAWLRADAEGSRAAGQGQPHRGAEAVRPRPRLIFQNADRRIVFAIPYEGDFTLIGTTDIDYDGDPGEATASDEEIDYLCAGRAEYFARPITVGRRRLDLFRRAPALDDGASEPRRRRATTCWSSTPPRRAPLLSVFGGKITTYRKLAEEALRLLGRACRLAERAGPAVRRCRVATSRGSALRAPRRRLSGGSSRSLRHRTGCACHRLARAYGSRVGTLLGNDGKAHARRRSGSRLAVRS